MSKRRLVSLGGLLLAGLILAIGFYFLAGKGSGRGRAGFPSDRSQPGTPQTVAGGDGDLIITSPSAGETVMSPLEVSGKARGSWYFEASFPVRLEDASGGLLAEAPAQAQGEWMTEDYVPFVAELSFTVATPCPGRLILRKDNPSGLAEHDAERSLALSLSPLRIVEVFFTNDRLDPEMTCEKVWPVPRTIAPGVDPKRAALEALLAGPTPAETASRYSTQINAGVVVQRIDIGADGIVRADFSPRIEDALGGSCRVGAIRAQISETLRQFADVREVVISVDGRVNDVLQP